MCLPVLCWQVPHVNCYPGRRSVVILDNASIQKCYDFVRMINEAGGIVLYLPPLLL